jgi:hypothetical protein
VGLRPTIRLSDYICFSEVCICALILLSLVTRASCAVMPEGRGVDVTGTTFSISAVYGHLYISAPGGCSTSLVELLCVLVCISVVYGDRSVPPA